MFTSFKKQSNIRKYLQNNITLFLISVHCIFSLSLSLDGHVYYFCATFPDSSLCKYNQVFVRVCVFPSCITPKVSNCMYCFISCFFPPTYQYILDLCQQSKLSNYSTTIIIYIYFYSCIVVCAGISRTACKTVRNCVSWLTPCW